MLEKSFPEVYDKFKLQFYKKVFELVRERDGSLSAMEAFSLSFDEACDALKIKNKENYRKYIS